MGLEMSKKDSYIPAYVAESGKKYWNFNPNRTVKNITYPIADRFDIVLMFCTGVRDNIKALTSGGIDISTLLFIEDFSQ